jgi:hypothetical protein
MSYYGPSYNCKVYAVESDCVPNILPNCSVTFVGLRPKCKLFECSYPSKNSSTLPPPPLTPALDPLRPAAIPAAPAGGNFSVLPLPRAITYPVRRNSTGPAIPTAPANRNSSLPPTATARSSPETTTKEKEVGMYFSLVFTISFCTPRFFIHICEMLNFPSDRDAIPSAFLSGGVQVAAFAAILLQELSGDLPRISGAATVRTQVVSCNRGEEATILY